MKKSTSPRKPKKSSALYSNNTDNTYDVEEAEEEVTTNSTLPGFEIKSNGTVSIFLTRGQEVFDQKGALNYADASIKVNTKTDGIVKGIIRALFTSESFFMTYYTGVLKRPCELSFSPMLDGEVFAVIMEPGSRYIMAQNSFLCATSNVKLSTDTRFKNMLEGENMFLTIASLSPESDDDGILWVSAYGGYEKLQIPEGVSMKVEHGYFCFSDANLTYSISKIGGLKTFFLGDGGFFMKFDGPCEIYVNCRNVGQTLDFIQNQLKIRSRQT